MAAAKSKANSHNDGITTTITVRGQKYELNDKQLDEVATRIAQDPSVGGVEVPKLKSYIERIERLEEDKAAIGSDIKDVFAEAKSNGFDVKAMRGVLKLRKLTTNERTAREYMLDLYKKALGMQPSFDFEGGE